MVTTKNIPAFGNSLPRFGKFTAHPNLDPSGMYCVRPDACDPCLYHPIPLHKIFEVNKNTKADKDPWRYKAELEDWGRNLGYRNQKILDYRRYCQSLLGPAWHDIARPPQYQSACPNVGFGRTSRTIRSKNRIPGPGTYYKSHPFKAPYGPHSTRQTFEREEPCRFKDNTRPWCLAPNRYNILFKDNIDQKSNKLVSVRGPYDLFTGERDGSTIKNHFNTSLRVCAATWPIALKGSLHKYDKSHFGTMNKTSRSLPYKGRSALVDLSMCRRRPEEPGPTHYPRETTGPRVFKQNKHGFNSSYDRGPGYQRVVVWPGVGRYSPKDGRCGLPGNGHRCVFLSKVERTMGSVIPKPMNSF